MALSVVKVLVTSKRDEVVRCKRRLFLVKHDGEFTLVRGDYCCVGLSRVKTITWSFLKRGGTSFAAINGWAWGVASNGATLNWCCSRGVHCGVVRGG